MPPPLTVFEVSWEVANKVGGIHTVLATKARSMVERLGDRYVCVGPWRLTDPRRAPAFEDERGFDGFCESCRSLGVPTRVGRWLVPGRPRAILVDASALFRVKDDVMARLWDQHRVDSLFGGWDYIEPLLFGHAAGVVIERWWQERVAPEGGEALLHVHEWRAGAALLHARDRLPSVATVWTTHATALGRALASTGLDPKDGLGARSPEQAAESLGVRSKHSMEAVLARECDVLTTVSDLVADEVSLLLGRRPSHILVDGIDASAGASHDASRDVNSRSAARDAAAAAMRRLAAAFVGGDRSVPVEGAIIATSGRCEMRNKGFDLLIDALGRVDKSPGPPVLALLLVPVGVANLRRDLVERLEAVSSAAGAPRLAGALGGVSTHDLLDGEPDVIGEACARAGLDNGPARRVRVVHLADYLAPGDGLLDLSYEDVLRGLDLACLPSFYEPWGYTPLEALAAGVPAVTSDRTGFGRWATKNGLGTKDGVTILRRRGRDDASAVADLAAIIDRFASGDSALRAPALRCRAAAERLSWAHALGPQDAAYDTARAAARSRAMGAAAAFSPAGAADDASATADGDGDASYVLPAPLRGLSRLARNLRWTWDPDAAAIFSALGTEAWDASHHNPVALLADAAAADLSAEAADKELVARIDAAVARVDAETGREQPVRGHLVRAEGAPAARARSPWPALALFSDDGPALSAKRPVAYFCAEFGLHESLTIYSGGLGVLAGDQLKAAHDEGVPLVAVGLFYRRGFLRQHLSILGEQIPLSIENTPRELPVTLVRDADGEPLRLDLDLPGTKVALVAWRVDVGRVPLYLLDADVPENRAEDRMITHRLYAGDAEARLRQEIVLGKGGVRLLARLGIEPSVMHLNEGHAAFAPLERVSRLVHQASLSFEEAATLVRATTAFTTHTPVPAGHDRFPEALMRRYFADCASWIGLSWERFFALGRAGAEPEFNLTYLGLRMTAWRNGVSRLHGRVSRRMLAPAWPGLLEDEVPVGHVTNGVHLPTWTAPAIATLVAGEAARTRPVVGDDFAKRGPSLDAGALWEARRAMRVAIVAAVRARVRAACEERREPEGVAERLTAALTDDALYIGFARRFATYKRADLLLRDMSRLVALVSRDDRPVRLLFAGKAHPSDRAGQDVLRRVVAASRRDDLAGRIVFLEDYDIALARVLVQGVDVWLNTPVRPMEASGTSGMKAACNGALHLSIRDGWWDEGFDGGKDGAAPNGFAIGDSATGATGAGREAADDLDASSLFRLLEQEVVPLFFERDHDGLPRRWLERVRRSLATVPPVFDARRMVREYTERAYRPLAEAGAALARDRFVGARDAAARSRRVRRAFASVRVATRRPADLSGRRAGDDAEVTADVELAGLSSADVVVEAVLSEPAAGARPATRAAATLASDAAPASGPQTFRGRVTLSTDGSSLAIRVRARTTGSEAFAAAGLADLVVWG